MTPRDLQPQTGIWRPVAKTMFPFLLFVAVRPIGRLRANHRENVEDEAGRRGGRENVSRREECSGDLGASLENRTSRA